MAKTFELMEEHMQAPGGNNKRTQIKRKETHEHDTEQRQDSLARSQQIIMHGGGGGACILSFPGLCSTVLFAAGEEHRPCPWRLCRWFELVQSNQDSASQRLQPHGGAKSFDLVCR